MGSFGGLYQGVLFLAFRLIELGGRKASVFRDFGILLGHFGLSVVGFEG